jgi:hypothetical protein
VLGLRVPVAAEDDAAPVGRPARLAGVRHARGQLPRRAPVGRDGEDLPVAVVDEALPVAPVAETRDHARRLGPLGALRCARHLQLPVVALQHQHAERERLAVGRPLEVLGRLVEPRDLRLAAAVEVLHEQLRARGLALRDVGQPGTVGRPAAALPFTKKRGRVPSAFMIQSDDSQRSFSCRSSAA